MAREPADLAAARPILEPLSTSILHFGGQGAGTAYKLINNLLGAASGGMMIVLNLGLGMNPALVGLLGALPRLTDAITDPLMGYISDHTKSRWGRRRPYIFVGAILAGILYVALWQLPGNKTETFYFQFKSVLGSWVLQREGRAPLIDTY